MWSQVEVSVVLAGAVTPFPSAISQGEKQLVVFEGSHLVPAAYQVSVEALGFYMSGVPKDIYF